MRHARWARAFAVVLGVWFAVVLTEPAALHACPEHGTAHHRDAQPHKGAAHHHGADGTSSSSAPTSHHQGCTCIGSCCAAPVTVIPPAMAVVIVETTTPRPGAVCTTLVAYHPSAPEHARPPSLGPPLSFA